MSQLVFSREIDGHLITARFDATEKSLSVEADGDLLALIKVDRHGAVAYTPAGADE